MSVYLTTEHFDFPNERITLKTRGTKVHFVRVSNVSVLQAYDQRALYITKHAIVEKATGAVLAVSEG
jgi:hypothetical protein